ncbi:MAG: glycyl radical protein [Clostridia bacterium]|nr:glycyl radical protein [Clostridia bacterium]
MKKVYTAELQKTPRIQKLIDDLYSGTPTIESTRAEIITESFKQTEGLSIYIRKAKAFKALAEKLPVVIRDDELIVGCNCVTPRGCPTFPEFSNQWLEDEFETVATRSADPFYISKETAAKLKEVHKYWQGRTTSELATSYMAPETLKAIEHNLFTVGNYFYNGIGHVNVDYAKVLKIGFKGIYDYAKAQRDQCNIYDGDYTSRFSFLSAVMESCEAAITFAKRYSAAARELAANCSDINRRNELLAIAEICNRVPENGAESFHEACQSFWFVQLLIQTESSGHSISPGRFDQYMYPYYIKDLESGKITREQAQELIDCVWVKLNSLNKVRDALSAEGFAGYSMFQNLIVGGQDINGLDATNDLSYMCISASMHVNLPQPSLSMRVWNGTPHDLMVKAAELTKTGIGFPAYYNDEIIIPALISRGLSLEDARDYCIIGCVEPQKGGKTDGWHDAAFFNMCRTLELVFSNGMDKGVQIGPKTGELVALDTYEKFFNAYKEQMDYAIKLMVNADNAVDAAHMERCPLPFLSSMVDDCIARGKSMQEGGAIYNFTGPQGFGIANVADALYAVNELVYKTKEVTLEEYADALRNNYGMPYSDEYAKTLTIDVVKEITAQGIEIKEEQIKEIFIQIKQNDIDEAKKAKYQALLQKIKSLPKFGNDIDEVDFFGREAAYTYTKPVEKYENPRGGKYHAGLYPVSANVPLGMQTGATPDGRLAGTPVADGVSPAAGSDVNGPTAAANSVAKLDHGIASNGTLFNMKFHPSALKGASGIEGFIALIRAYFDQKGMHMQFNVVSRETLRDAQKHPENYKSLVVRVAGYSALFTTLSKTLQDDIINRTEQGGF